MNAPHAWQMGWTTTRTFNGSNLPAATTYESFLGIGSVSPGMSAIRIVPTWAPGVDPIFVGFRWSVRGDEFLPLSLSNRVHIYSSSISGSRDAKPSYLRASLRREPPLHQRWGCRLGCKAEAAAHTPQAPRRGLCPTLPPGPHLLQKMRSGRCQQPTWWCGEKQTTPITVRWWQSAVGAACTRAPPAARPASTTTVTAWPALQTRIACHTCRHPSLGGSHQQSAGGPRLMRLGAFLW